jgi:hypothetical protein
MILRKLHSSSAAPIVTFTSILIATHLLALAGVEQDIAFMRTARLAHRFPVVEGCFPGRSRFTFQRIWLGAPRLETPSGLDSLGSGCYWRISGALLRDAGGCSDVWPSGFDLDTNFSKLARAARLRLLLASASRFSPGSNSFYGPLVVRWFGNFVTHRAHTRGELLSGANFLRSSSNIRFANFTRSLKLSFAAQSQQEREAH